MGIGARKKENKPSHATGGLIDQLKLVRELVLMAGIFISGAAAAFLWVEKRFVPHLSGYNPIVVTEGLIRSEKGLVPKSDGFLFVHLNGTREKFYATFEILKEGNWTPVMTSQTIAGEVPGNFTIPLIKGQPWRLVSDVKDVAAITMYEVSFKSDWLGSED